MFDREDWMLFRSIDSLGQKAGVGRDRIAAVVVKELVDNALDAGTGAASPKVTVDCEEVGPAGRGVAYAVVTPESRRASRDTRRMRAAAAKRRLDLFCAAVAAGGE